MGDPKMAVTKPNWRRGLFRVWIVISAVWMAYVFAVIIPIQWTVDIIPSISFMTRDNSRLEELEAEIVERFASQNAKSAGKMSATDAWLLDLSVRQRTIESLPEYTDIMKLRWARSNVSDLPENLAMMFAPPTLIPLAMIAIFWTTRRIACWVIAGFSRKA